MKQLYLLLFFLVTGFTLSAQGTAIEQLSDYLEKRKDFSEVNSPGFEKMESLLNTASKNQQEVQSNASHKLDSVIIYTLSASDELIPSSKEAFVYNPEGNVAEERFYIWSEDDNVWMPAWRDVLIYDNQGRFVENIEYEWNEQGSQWVPSYREVISYMGSGDIQEVISYFRSGGQWILEFKTEVTYISPGIIDEITSYYWDETEEIWIPDYQLVYDNSVPNTTIITESLWDENSDAWELESRLETEEDSRGNEIRFSYFSWLFFEGEWLEEFRTESFYDPNDNLIEEISYFGNEDDELEPANRDRLSYNDENFLTSDTSFIWDDFEEIWVPFIFTSYEYDNLGNPIFEADHIEFVFDWEVFQESTISYNQDIPFSNILWPFNSGFSILRLDMVVSQPLGYTIVDLLLGTDIISEEGVFFYSEMGGTNVEEIDANALAVIPNPVADQISVMGDNLEGTNFSLYDLQGRLVFNRTLSQGQPLFVGDLSSGMYLYRIEGNGLVHNGKLIKQ